MIKATELLGRHVVTTAEGTRIAKVHDLIFDYDANELAALLIDEGGWFRAAQVVPYSAVRSLGEEVVMVESDAAVINASDNERIKTLLEGQQKILVGLKLLTTDGRDLGRIADVYIDPLSGQVLGYEATGGLFADLSSGRTFVPAPHSIQIGTDAAIVPPSIVNAMQETEPGGIKGTFKRVSDSVKDSYQETASGVRGSVQEAADTLREGYQQAAQSVQEQLDDLKDATQERQAEFALGKVAGMDVTDSAGQVIVPEGHTITQQHIDQAQKGGAMLRLITAASTGSVKQGAQHLSEQTREQVSEAGEQLKAKVDPVREQVSAAVTEAGKVVSSPVYGSDGAQRMVVTPGMPEPVQDIVGRRVLHDVYGENRTLIAAQGQIISPELLARARTQGREQALIDAVTSATPPLSDKLAEGVAEVSAGAGQLFNKAKQWLDEKREELNTTIEQQEREANAQRIKDILGRPTKRAVLDSHDHVILNIGDVITNASIQEARQAGVLPMLLNSVD